MWEIDVCFALYLHLKTDLRTKLMFFGLNNPCESKKIIRERYWNDVFKFSGNEENVNFPWGMRKVNKYFLKFIISVLLKSI